MEKQLVLKTINELVKEGYEVYIQWGTLSISKSNVSAEIEVDCYENSCDGENTVYEKTTWGYDTDHGAVPNEFIKEVLNESVADFWIADQDETLEVKKDGSVQVGCTHIDKKQALEIAKAILIANDYDVD